MLVHMMEDYRIRLRTGRAEPTGTYEVTRRGTKKAITHYVITYQTNAGDFKHEEWVRITKQLIEQSGSEYLLERIKEYCKENRLWLHTEKEIEEHSIDCLLSRAYRNWDCFSMIGLEEPNLFVFTFKEEDLKE